MNESVDLIQSKIAAIVDADPDVTNISTEDYALRLSYINLSLREWAEIYDWQALYKEFNSLVSTSAGNASVALPSDFRKLASFPKITYDGSNTALFPEIRPQDRGQYADTDKRVEILGNNQGYIMRVYGSTLASGASVFVPYYSSVASLVSPANIPEIPNADYLVQRTVAYWWEVRGDPRFVQKKQESERILGNLIDYENVFGEASTNDRVKTADETKFKDFRWGDN